LSQGLGISTDKTLRQPQKDKAPLDGLCLSAQSNSRAVHALFDCFFTPYAIKTPILNHLLQVLLADMLRSIEIGEGAGDLKDARIAAGGEAETFGNEFEETMAGFVRSAQRRRVSRRRSSETAGVSGHRGKKPQVDQMRKDAGKFYLS
jgi:hypothetical protein